MDDLTPKLAAQIQKLAIDLSDAGLVITVPNKRCWSVGEVERISSELNILVARLQNRRADASNNVANFVTM